MKTPNNLDLIKLANAAFQEAALDVIRRAEAAGTPIIVWENEKVKRLTPRQARGRLNGKKGKRQ
jgi:hypothetical protein